jgi:hypothetical protein
MSASSPATANATPSRPVDPGRVGIWARDPMAMAGGLKTLTEAYPGRFLLGIGVSHQPAVDYLRGQHYDQPLARMRSCLDAMDSALFMAKEPTQPPQRMLAALGPRMLELAAARIAGAHTYFVPVEHTVVARRIMGPTRCSASNRQWWSKPTRPWLADSAADTWPSTSGWRTTPTTSSGWGGPTPIWPAGDPMPWSTPSSRGRSRHRGRSGPGPARCRCRPCVPAGLGRGRGGGSDRGVAVPRAGRARLIAASRRNWFRFGRVPPID